MESISHGNKSHSIWCTVNGTVLALYSGIIQCYTCGEYRIMYRDVELPCCMLKTNITLSSTLKFKVSFFFKDSEVGLQEKTLTVEGIRRDVDGMAFVPSLGVGVIWTCRYAGKK